MKFLGLKGNTPVFTVLKLVQALLNLTSFTRELFGNANPDMEIKEKLNCDDKG